MPPRMIVIRPGEDPHADRKVWGTGGWLRPPDRETLDWATLALLAGWDVVDGMTDEVTAGAYEPADWIILAKDGLEIPEELRHALESSNREDSFMVITRVSAEVRGAALDDIETSGESTMAWVGPGPGRQWILPSGVHAYPLTQGVGDVWATLNGLPIITASQRGPVVEVNLGFHPSAARDASGSFTALLRHLLVWGLNRPIAWQDFTGTVVLRIDDPGSAQNVHLGSWAHRELGPADWTAIGNILHHFDARLTVGYCAGWMDDGDHQRGRLLEGGPAHGRAPGAVYPSARVVYEDLGGHLAGTLHDYRGEFEAIEALTRAGLVSVEQHGFTHMHPDGREWADAQDAYTSESWYREFGERAQPALDRMEPHEHPLRRGFAELSSLSIRPSTLIFPGDAWTTKATEIALELGFQALSSYYTAIRHQDRFLWVTHLCAPYLDEPDPRWFESELPTVGYFHDRDVALHGTEWLMAALDRWRSVGAQRFIDFRTMVTALRHSIEVVEDSGGLRVLVDSGNDEPPVAELSLGLRAQRALPDFASIEMAGRSVSVPVERRKDGTGRILISIPQELR